MSNLINAINQAISENDLPYQWPKKINHELKNIIFDKTDYGINYAIHKEAFKDYHINGLHYSNSEKLATIPNGDVGGAGEAIDKVYNIAWTTKDEWLIKRNEVKSLYTS